MTVCRVFFPLMFVVCAISLHAESPVPTSAICEQSLTTAKTLSRLHPLQAAWDPPQFSNPQNFDPNHFQFIVHAGPHVTISGGDALAVFMKHVRTHDFNTD